MSKRPMSIVVLGLSLSSSWGNGHATTYRALLRSMAARGHDITFIERDVAWYAANRDLVAPDYCRLVLYRNVRELQAHRTKLAAADAVIVGSFVPDGIEVGELVLRTARGLTAFYDIDTPVTLAQLGGGTCTYLAARQVSRYDLYLSFTGGPTLQHLQKRHGSKCARALYCSVDVETFKPQKVARRWALGYLGTYSPDRQPTLDRLLVEPARRRPDLRFVIAGAQYPDPQSWPGNVTYIPHLTPAELPAFYSSLGWALNITRADMIKAGWSPSVRLFEAAACGAPLITDSWPGLDSILMAGTEIVTATDPDDVLSALGKSAARRQRIAEAARRRVTAVHSSDHRALELESWLQSAIATKQGGRRQRRGFASETKIDRSCIG